MRNLRLQWDMGSFRSSSACWLCNRMVQFHSSSLAKSWYRKGYCHVIPKSKSSSFQYVIISHIVKQWVPWTFSLLWLSDKLWSKRNEALEKCKADSMKKALGEYSRSYDSSGKAGDKKITPSWQRILYLNMYKFQKESSNSHWCSSIKELMSSSVFD